MLIQDRLRKILNLLWGTQGPINRRIVQSGIWLSASATSSHVLGFVQTMILVRLLEPADFGVSKIAGILLAAITTFTELGMGQALVHKKVVTRETLDTAWTAGVARSIFIYACIFFLAPWMAQLYKNDLITPIIRVVALRILANGFVNIGIKMLVKDMDFRKHELLEAFCNVACMSVTVFCAYWLRSVWALAIGQASFAVFRLIGSYIAHPFRPRLFINWEELRELYRFGRFIFLIAGLTYLKQQMDSAILGKILDMTLLGFYALAVTLSRMPTKLVTSVVGTVMFPAFSKMRDDPEKLKSGYLKALRVNSAMALPAAAGMFILAPQIISVAYGAKYAPMIPCFTVLCIYAAARSLAAVGGPIFFGTGRPHMNLMLTAADLVVMLGLIFPLTHRFELVGTAWATTIPTALTAIAALAISTRIAGVRLLQAGWILGQVLVSCILMMAAVYGVRAFYGNATSVLDLIGYILVGLGTYPLILLVLARDTSRTILRIVSVISGGGKNADVAVKQSESAAI